MLWGNKRLALQLAMGAATVAMTAGAASAAVISGEANGLSWTAQSTIIGMGPTGQGVVNGRLGPGGDATHLPEPSKHSGVAALIMEYSNGNRFICSGSLSSGGNSIVTAGHCVSGGGGVTEAGLVKTTAYFWDYSTQGDERVPFNPKAVAIEVTDYFVHPDYTGEVIDQNDIAVLALKNYAPAFAQRYELYDEGDLTGKNFNVTGYGTRSAVGGATGNTGGLPSTGYLREGDNKYDYAWGDSRFQGFFTDRDVNGENFFGTAEVEFSYISDFDNGTLAQDQARRIANALGLGPLGNTFFNDQGLGAREVGVAGGDSGGGAFIDGKLASVNSYGLTFGTAFGDFGGGLNSGWGEFSGYVPIFIHTDFINDAIAAAVPEPTTWALMIGGFGLAGASLRRRRLAVAKA